MMNKLTLETFIQKAKLIHINKYDYSKTEYTNYDTNVTIICPIHGEYKQTPNNHLQGKGCPKCANEQHWHTRGRITTEEFINKAKAIHGEKYDYSKTEYINSKEKICIICSIHGEFYQTPDNHINLRQGCSKCSCNTKVTTEDFIKRAKEVHNDKYDYSKTEYINAKTKVCIICPIHGEFFQIPNSHLNGCGCNKCGLKASINKQRSSTEEWIKKAIEIHEDKYDYSKVEYINSKTKVCIICNEHGEFWMKPSNHITKKYNCPYCKIYKLENEIEKLLSDNNIIYEQQKHFPWLGRQSLDFFIESIHLAIECQGEQHFKPIDFAGKGIEWANQNFEYMKQLDDKKKSLCEQHNIQIIYYGEYKVNKELLNKNKIIEIINEYKSNNRIVYRKSKITS